MGAGCMITGAKSRRIRIAGKNEAFNFDKHLRRNFVYPTL
jgi:hypothetical protein